MIDLPDREFLITSFRKDMRFSFMPFLRVVSIPLITSLVMLLIFMNTTMLETERMDGKDYPDDGYRPEYEFLGMNVSDEEGTEDEFEEKSSNEADYLYESRGASMTAIASFFILYLPIFLVLMVLHSLVFTRERRKGAIRSYFHYKVSIDQLLISKSLNVMIMMTVLSILSLIFISVLMLGDNLMVMEFIGVFSLSIIFILAQYAFFCILSPLILKSKQPGIDIIADPLFLMVFINGALLMLTESAIITSYNVMAILFKWNPGVPSLVVLKYLSPYHTFGVLTDLIFFGGPVSILDFLWVPLMMIIVTIALIGGRGNYPDVFIKETA